VLLEINGQDVRGESFEVVTSLLSAASSVIWLSLRQPPDVTDLTTFMKVRVVQYGVLRLN
jgi:hypothetical protein